MRDRRATEGQNLDVAAYAARLAYRGKLDLSVDTLRGLHEAHAFTVPFENLDVHLERPISLDPSVLFKKIVQERRGGYCFELNGLFAVILETLGFTVHRLMARVLYGAAMVRPLSHEVLLVDVEGARWIADVGFGGNGLIAPFPLCAGHEERQYQDHFRLIGHEDRNRRTFALQFETRGTWHDLYEFTLEPYRPEDYILANYYHSHASDSLFVQHVICTKPTIEGRVTLLDRKLKVRTKGVTQHSTVNLLDDFQTLLKAHFGIEHDGIAGGVARTWDRLGV
ncbi:MAG: arylamine N-acetyltransferase [Nitrospirae bacterium]|nr:MAG: arylamine N-acetyltransferase [Nitrospirota bacterium]